MRQVLIHRPRLALRAANGDTGRSGIIEQGITTRKSLVELGQSPRRNDLDLGLQGVEAELEADLIVALAGATVRDGDAVLLLRDGDLGAGDDGARQRGAEQVDVLVDGVALNGREAELLDELAAQVLDVAGDGSDLQGLGFGSLEVLYVVSLVRFRVRVRVAVGGGRSR